MTADMLSFLFMFVVGWAIQTCAAVTAPTLQMNDGRKIPIVGLGTALFGKPEEDALFKAVGISIDYGYRHIDTALIYDNDEQIIGEALKQNIDEEKVKREEMFITTKLWNDAHRPEKVEPSLRGSLERLKLDYVDLYLMHFPLAYYENGTIDTIDFVETWKVMEELKKKGLALSIGVSNFNEKQLTRLLEEASIKPAVLQIEVHPTLTEKKLVKFSQDHGIVVTAFSPFGAMPASKRDQDSPPPRWDDPILSAIANKTGKTVAQVVLRYMIQRNIVVIPKSVTPSRIKENINIFDFNLTPEEMQQVEDFNLDFRVLPNTQFSDHPEYPFKL